MASKMLELLQKDFDEAKAAPLLAKGSAMERVAARTLSILTDVENRLQTLERRMPG